MIALTGILTSTEVCAPLCLLEQSLRRHYETVRVGPDQIMVRMGRWIMLLTTEASALRLDVVVHGMPEADAVRDRIDLELSKWVFPAAVRLTWEQSRSIPTLLRS
jgi:hypothetical protein